MDKNKEQLQDTELDEFAQALLNKKRDLALEHNQWKERQKKNSQDRQQAQKALQDALDQLRADRGQAPIEQEEQSFDDLDEFDSTSLNLADLSDYENPSAQAISDFTSPIQLEKPVDQKQKVEVETKPKDVETTKPVKKKGRGKWILLVIVLFALALGGYSYKTLVWDPANTVTKKQQAIYNELIAYADEWEMLSDSEKNELLTHRADYNKLLEKQKVSLNDYFKEQTKSTFTQLIKQLQKQKDEKQQAAYQQIADALSNYAAMSQTDQFSLIDLQDTYSSLTNARKQKIDQLSKEKTGKTFLKLISELQAQKSEADQAAKKAQIDNQIANLESQLALYQEQLENYKKYQSDLQQELADPESYGTTKEAIQEAMRANEQAISSVNTTIENIQKQIEQLKA